MKNILAALLLAASTLTASANDLRQTEGRFDLTDVTAQHRIDTDYGGSLVEYITKYEALRAIKAKVEINGTCISACTFVLAIMPREDVCVGDRALFAFHSASLQTPFGPIFHHEATRLMWNMYPKSVRKLLLEKGWDGEADKPHPELIYIKGDRLYPRCSDGVIYTEGTED